MSRRREKLYHVFYGMKARCYNVKDPKYYLYGGNGIKICPTWLNDYEAFKQWSVHNGYKEDEGLSIDRIDAKGDYSPENCRWISLSANSARASVGHHKHKSKKENMFAISPEGNIVRIYNISEFCREYDLGRASVSHRLNGTKDSDFKGWKFYTNTQWEV